jgi:UDP-glucose 6-dehydrogenase
MHFNSNEKTTSGVTHYPKSFILHSSNQEISFDLISNPEFLREGKALQDALYPERIVVGCETEKAQKLMKVRIYSKSMPALPGPDKGKGRTSHSVYYGSLLCGDIV